MSTARPGPDAMTSMPARDSVKSILLPARSLTPQPQPPQPHRHLPVQRKPPQYTPPPRQRRASAAPVHAPHPLPASSNLTAASPAGQTYKPIVPVPEQVQTAVLLDDDLRRPTPTFGSNSRKLDRLMSEFDALIVNSSTPDLAKPFPAAITPGDWGKTQPHHEETSTPVQFFATSAVPFEAVEFAIAVANESVEASSEKSPVSPSYQSHPPAVHIPKRRQSYAWKEHLSEFNAL
ncbi:hypothetical protein HDU83_006107 [Entophlyctis luteolus]|nr:hypothetical protein HDU83_006107 [Entophlyctis luteolus]